MRTSIYGFFYRREQRKNIEKLCAQLCETLCNKEEGSQSYTKDSTKKTLRNFICLDFYSKTITF